MSALKIGRLCVDGRFVNRGIGTIITEFCMALGTEIGKDVGCRFIVLDSKKTAADFYKKLGFNILRDDKENLPIYFDLIEKS